MLIHIRSLIVYNVVVFVLFTILYSLVGFDGRNFVVSQNIDIPRWFGPVYYSVQTHVHLAYGDVVSKSSMIRTLTCIHIFLSYANLFLLPFIVTRI